MPKITAIQPVQRPIRVTKRSAAEVCWDARYFSLRAYDAGAESGIRLHPQELQFDREQAAVLRTYLDRFLKETKEDA